MKLIITTIWLLVFGFEMFGQLVIDHPELGGMYYPINASFSFPNANEVGNLTFDLDHNSTDDFRISWRRDMGGISSSSWVKVSTLGEFKLLMDTTLEYVYQFTDPSTGNTTSTLKKALVPKIYHENDTFNSLDHNIGTYGYIFDQYFYMWPGMQSPTYYGYRSLNGHGYIALMQTIGNVKNAYVVEMEVNHPHYKIISVRTSNSPSEIVVFPNPTKDFIYVHSKSDRIILSDLNGKTLIDIQSPRFNEQLSVEGQAIGIYLLSVFTSDGNVTTKRIIKM